MRLVFLTVFLLRHLLPLDGLCTTLRFFLLGLGRQTLRHARLLCLCLFSALSGIEQLLTFAKRFQALALRFHGRLLAIVDSKLLIAILDVLCVTTFNGLALTLELLTF